VAGFRQRTGVETAKHRTQFGERPIEAKTLKINHLAYRGLGPYT